MENIQYSAEKKEKDFIRIEQEKARLKEISN
jgi:hypothetical protein